MNWITNFIQDFDNVHGKKYFPNVGFLFQKQPLILCLWQNIKTSRWLLYIWFCIKDQISDFCFRNFIQHAIWEGQYFGSLVNGNQCLTKQSVAMLIFLLWHLIIFSLADPQMAFFNPENIWLNTFYVGSTVVHIFFGNLGFLWFLPWNLLEWIFTNIYIYLLTSLKTLPNLHPNLPFQTLFYWSLQMFSDVAKWTWLSFYMHIHHGFFIPVLPFFEMFLTSNNPLDFLSQTMLPAIAYHMCNASALYTLHWLSLADIFPLNYASIALSTGIISICK